MADNKKDSASYVEKTESYKSNQQNYIPANSSNQVGHKTLEEILNMKGSEGLIVSCNESQVDQFLSTLVDEEIITSPDIFNTIYTFETGFFQDDSRVLFLFDDIKNPKEIDIPKLAVWRILTYDYVQGTWLSDFIDNNTREV